jgi:hypothetical protein
MKNTAVTILIFLTAVAAMADVEAGKAALRRGDYVAAYRAFLPDAQAADDRAMVTIGLLYYRGQLGSIDYVKAMDWYVRAFDRQNGDAFNNIGVMYRDGLGVKKNRVVAYSLFLIVHLAGLGSEDTQIRANDNLRRIVAEIPATEVAQALCSTDEYIVEYVHSRGNLPVAFKPSAKAVRLRDKDWWLPSEEANLPKCK